MPNSDSGETQWFESESFWTDYAPVLFDEERWSEAAGVAESVVRMAELTAGDRILDAGCGPGRIAVELAALGMNVTGVDLIGAYLAAARESAEAEGVEIEWIRGDLRVFRRPDAFEAAVSLYTSFGYCRTREEDLRILTNIADSLKPGGRLILECVSRETALSQFTPGEEFERGGFRVKTRFKRTDGDRGLVSQWDIDNGKIRRTHTFVQRLYSSDELKAFLLSRGDFRSVTFFGNWQGAPFDSSADTMILFAEKSAEQPLFSD